MKSSFLNVDVNFSDSVYQSKHYPREGDQNIFLERTIRAIVVDPPNKLFAACNCNSGSRCRAYELFSNSAMTSKSLVPFAYGRLVLDGRWKFFTANWFGHLFAGADGFPGVKSNQSRSDNLPRFMYHRRYFNIRRILPGGEPDDPQNEMLIIRVGHLWVGIPSPRFVYHRVHCSTRRILTGGKPR